MTSYYIRHGSAKHGLKEHGLKEPESLEHRWMVEMEIQTHLGQRALYKIPIWSTSEKKARHRGAKHANEMQSGVVKVCSMDVYRLRDDEILLPGLYPMEQRHHLANEPVAPFDSVQDLPSFERALHGDFRRGGKYVNSYAKGCTNGYLYRAQEEDEREEEEEERTQFLFDSIETDRPEEGVKGRPLWKRLLCCFCSNETSKQRTRLRADSW